MYLPVLPTGQRWRFVFDHSVTVLGGGKTLEVAFDLDTFPLFERLGPGLGPA